MAITECSNRQRARNARLDNREARRMATLAKAQKAWEAFDAQLASAFDTIAVEILTAWEAEGGYDGEDDEYLLDEHDEVLDDEAFMVSEAEVAEIEAALAEYGVTSYQDLANAIEAEQQEADSDEQYAELVDLMGAAIVFDPADVQWGMTVSTRPVGSHGGARGNRDEAGQWLAAR